MTRPRGAFRQALASTAWQIAAERSSGFTWRELYEHTPLVPGLVPRVAKKIIENMACAGELRKVGEATMPHARRPMALLLPHDAEHGAPVALEAVLRAWSR